MTTLVEGGCIQWTICSLVYSFFGYIQTLCLIKNNRAVRGHLQSTMARLFVTGRANDLESAAFINIKLSYGYMVGVVIFVSFFSTNNFSAVLSSMLYAPFCLLLLPTFYSDVL